MGLALVLLCGASLFHSIWRQAAEQHPELYVLCGKRPGTLLSTLWKLERLPRVCDLDPLPGYAPRSGLLPLLLCYDRLREAGIDPDRDLEKRVYSARGKGLGLWEEDLRDFEAAGYKGDKLAEAVQNLALWGEFVGHRHREKKNPEQVQREFVKGWENMSTWKDEDIVAVDITCLDYWGTPAVFNAGMRWIGEAKNSEDCRNALRENLLTLFIDKEIYSFSRRYNSGAQIWLFRVLPEDTDSTPPRTYLFLRGVHPRVVDTIRRMVPILKAAMPKYVLSPEELEMIRIQRELMFHDPFSP